MATPEAVPGRNPQDSAQTHTEVTRTLMRHLAMNSRSSGVMPAESWLSSCAVQGAACKQQARVAAQCSPPVLSLSVKLQHTEGQPLQQLGKYACHKLQAALPDVCVVALEVKLFCLAHAGLYGGLQAQTPSSVNSAGQD